MSLELDLFRALGRRANLSSETPLKFGKICASPNGRIGPVRSRHRQPSRCASNRRTDRCSSRSPRRHTVRYLGIEVAACCRGSIRIIVIMEPSSRRCWAAGGRADPSSLAALTSAARVVNRLAANTSASGVIAYSPETGIVGRTVRLHQPVALHLLQDPQQHLLSDPSISRFSALKRRDLSRM